MGQEFLSPTDICEHKDCVLKISVSKGEGKAGRQQCHIYISIMIFSYKNIIKLCVEFYVSICISKDHWGKKICVSGLYQALAQYSTFRINMDTIISIELLIHSLLLY